MPCDAHRQGNGSEHELSRRRSSFDELIDFPDDRQGSHSPVRRRHWQIDSLGPVRVCSVKIIHSPSIIIAKRARAGEKKKRALSFFRRVSI